MIINTHNWISSGGWVHRTLLKLRSRLRSPDYTRYLLSTYKSGAYALNRRGDYLYVTHPNNTTIVTPILVDVLYAEYLE